MEQEVANANSVIILLILALVASVGIMAYRFIPKRKPKSVAALNLGAASPQHHTPASSQVTPGGSASWSKNTVQTAFLGSYPLESFMKWFIRISTAIVLVLAILVTFGIISVNHLPSPTAVHWVALFGLFGLMAIALPKGKGKNSALLLLGLVSLAFLIIEGEGAINSMAKRLDRHFNHGDWSAPASEVRTVSDGTVVMHRGKQERFYVVGTVRLINNNDYTCLKISPEGRFAIMSKDDFRTNFITPKSGEKEMVFVEVKNYFDCK